MFFHIALLFSIVFIANAAELPPFIIPCSRHLLDLNECISNNLEDAKPYLAEGVPELSIPSLKHVTIPYSFINKTNFECGVWNFNISGFENFNVLKVDADLKKNLFKFQLEFPAGEAIGSYGCKGNFLNLNMDGTGPFEINATQLIVNLELKTKLVQRNGLTYFQQVYKHLDARIDGVFFFYMHDLYLGNNEITEIMNRILNENSMYVFNVLSPILKERLGSLLDKAIDNFFEIYTYDELLP
ncbi:PREDICTED: uncharacterized protein LOC108565827 [Nicrophorus vespilloides]|uniref:Uncharacterized protein LOC108565827 n=1 Tax=Nicrophorus vespilloides TaxID=110193 RepID=A0ABM1N2B1_NICVS|nr:PREDICTED: uncharacterized protein LOC108565827 [Nicrophorus vespilloides]